MKFYFKRSTFGCESSFTLDNFKRDRKIFEEKYPALKIIEICPLMPFMYLLNGGVKNNIIRKW